MPAQQWNHSEDCERRAEDKEYDNNEEEEENVGKKKWAKT